ncbi:MAG: DUF4405 domain-containing protein [Prolixibacteraceae bacterium]|nr:DUF4405 domain-containing protein [Prolixibacteraceae bacterium]
MIKIKPKTNLLIDAILLLLLMAMAGLGLLIKYVLVPGFKRNDLYGSDVELFFWGYDRHQWGTVHLWVSLGFIFLVILHIIFHWRMIGCIFRQIFGTKASRIIVVSSLVFFSLLFVITPLLIKPDIAPMNNHHINHQKVKIINDSHHNNSSDTINVIEKDQAVKSIQTTTQHENLHVGDQKGSMTLAQFAHQQNVSLVSLAASMGIPEAICNERIGRLRRIYGFEIETLRNKTEQIKTNER